MEILLIEIRIKCRGQGHPDEGEVKSTREIREEGTLIGAMATIKSTTTTQWMDFLFENESKTKQQVVVEYHSGGADVAIIEDGVTREGRIKIKIACEAMAGDEYDSGKSATAENDGDRKATSV